jgi:hypothetical protein
MATLRIQTMTELEEVFQEFKEEFGLEQCTVCMEPTVMRDVVGFPWCAEHEHHGKVMSWGKRHDYPELDAYTYKIGPSEYCWWFAVAKSAECFGSKGDEGYMWTILAYIEDLDSQGQRKAS